jgi:hypothetical protein
MTCTPGQIPKTTLGSSDPVDLCKGFSLFPKLGSARAGISSFDRSTKLFDTQPQILAWRMRVFVNTKVLMGVCGPSYGLRFAAEGTSSGNALTLKVTDDDIQAGFFFGVNVEITLGLVLEQLIPRWIWDGWNSRLETQWVNAVNASFTIRADLVEIILGAILSSLKAGGKAKTALKKVKTFTPALLGAWGFFDESKGGFVPGEGTWSLAPSVRLPLNIVPLTKTLPPPLNAPFLLDAALAPLCGYFQLGPSIGISIPTDVRVAAMTVDGKEYPNVEFKNGMLVASGGPKVPDCPKTLGARLEHKPGFDVGFGIFATLAIMKLFSFDASFEIPVLNLLNIRIDLGTYANTVASNVGGGIPEGTSGLRGAREAELIDVVFEPPSATA